MLELFYTSFKNLACGVKGCKWILLHSAGKMLKFPIQIKPRQNSDIFEPNINFCESIIHINENLKRLTC